MKHLTAIVWYPITNKKVNCLSSFHITSMACIKISVREWRYTTFLSKGTGPHVYNPMEEQQNHCAYHLDKSMTNKHASPIT